MAKKDEDGDEDENEQIFKLMIRKGVYPYTYVSKFSKLKETRLPSKKKVFTMILMINKISDDDYNHACTVWDKFNSEILGDYIITICI